MTFDKVGGEPVLRAAAWQCGRCGKRWVSACEDLIGFRLPFPIGSASISHIDFKGSQASRNKEKIQF